MEIVEIKDNTEESVMEVEKDETGEKNRRERQKILRVRIMKRPKVTIPMKTKLKLKLMSRKTMRKHLRVKARLKKMTWKVMKPVRSK